MSEHEEVERPAVRNRNLYGVDYDALCATAETGKALRIPLNGRYHRDMINAMGAALRSRGFRLRSRVAGDHIIAWAEKR